MRNRRSMGISGLIGLVRSILSFSSSVLILFPQVKPVFFQMPEPIDSDTPQDTRTPAGFDGLEYGLIFSDEFERHRTFLA